MSRVGASKTGGNVTFPPAVVHVDWMPFAGRKNSGFGVGGIPHSIEEMSQSKMVVFSFN